MFCNLQPEFQRAQIQKLRTKSSSTTVRIPLCKCLYTFTHFTFAFKIRGTIHKTNHYFPPFFPHFNPFPLKYFFIHSHSSAVYSFKLFNCNIIRCQIHSELKYTQHFSLYWTHSEQQSFSYLYLLRLHKFLFLFLSAKTTQIHADYNPKNTSKDY